MKRLAFLLFAVAAVVCANAKILRVSNVNGSTAPYTTLEAALEAAEAGDVIMLDASPNSYAYAITINKSVTIQGPGYWLVENGKTQDGINSALIDRIRIEADGVKLISLEIGVIEFGAEKGCKDWVITRCKINNGFALTSKDSHGIIHQNFMKTGIGGATASFLQITNNIILRGTTINLTNSIIKYNTIAGNANLGSNIVYSTVENNIGLQNGVKDNSTYTNNIGIPEGVNYSYDKDIDTDVKEKDATISTTHGAFAGEDPYVISGIAPGPYIEDITVPVSVEQGKDMEVTVKIGTSR